MESREDAACKRRLQRIRVRDTAKPLEVSLQEKSTKLKLHPLKLLMLLLLTATLVKILLSSPVCHNHTISNSVSQQHLVKRWIWGGDSDPRYVSNLDMNSDEIAEVLEKIAEEKSIRRIGLLNFNESEVVEWKQLVPFGNHTVLKLEHAAENLRWDVLYPEWIDEEQEDDLPSCPDFPRIQVPEKRLHLIAVKLPCQKVANWSRDVGRLHLQLAAAGLAASIQGNHPVHLLFHTKCFPIPNLFSCKELVARRGSAWLYKPHLNVVRGKVQLPIGSCELALPHGANEGNQEYGVKREENQEYGVKRPKEAYATVLHSAHVYVCGAITAAQSIRMAGSTRDLVILVDASISAYHRSGLQAAGWKIRTIERIRNPKAEKDAYNEWNYSKFRLWQLTDYDKIIFIDSDLLILKNIDFLFKMPEISATGNNGTLFNSGVMVIEPSNCTFRLLMDHINEIESYNGGDQGYLNEIFTWWHRIPKHINFLKHFWIGDEEQVKQKKIRLFGAEPPVLYVLHYLGYKPWLCYRDYDCNWNVDILQEFASDTAHRSWWKVHDAMPKRLQDFCMVNTKQKAQLEWDRREAEKANYTDGHWKLRIRDPRQKKCIDRLCSWKGMLKHWGEKNWTNQPIYNPTPPAITAAIPSL